MSTKKISELVAASSLGQTDELVIVQGGVTKKISAGSARIGRTGWEYYKDSNVIAANGQNILAAGNAELSIDGNTTIATQAPADAVAALWNTTTDRIMPIADGDSYDCRIGFIAENYSGSSPYLEIEVDIGGAQGVIAGQTVPLLKGGSAQKIMCPIPVFTGSTFIANGGLIRVKYEGTTSVDIHSAEILIVRTHSA